MLRGSAPLKLNTKALVNYRVFHGETKAGDWHMDMRRIENSLRVHAFEGAVPFYVFSDRAKIEIKNEWYRGFSLSIEQYRGFTGLDDHLHAGVFRATLTPDETLTIVLSTDPAPNLDGETALAERQAYETEIAGRAPHA